ncbi:MAG: hypothetical protein CML69_10815 [Rhodobacteraceae bacterium]|nr:hypothetical protein [Paracoccaceae bacterium]
MNGTTKGNVADQTDALAAKVASDKAAKDAAEKAAKDTAAAKSDPEKGGALDAAQKSAIDAAEAIDTEKVQKVLDAMNGDSRPMKDMLEYLSKVHGASGSHKDGLYILEIAGITGKSRISEREVLTNWQNAARRALLRAA